MTTYVALLRGINVGGHKAVSMAELRAMMESLKFTKVKTLLQSGNLLFDGRRQSTATLETTLNKEIHSRLGVDSEIFIRTADEWADVVNRNPFAREAENDPGHLIVVFLRESATAENVRALQDAIVGREIMRVSGREAYFIYPDGMGTSKLTNALIEKKLGTRGTARNWNTVRKILLSSRA